MNGFDWQQTVAKAAEGDSRAFEALYKQTDRSVYFTCLKLLKNEHDAKDVMQDTYIKAFEKLSELSDFSRFPQWINRIAINHCKTFFRRQNPDHLEDAPEQAAVTDTNDGSSSITDSSKKPPKKEDESYPQFADCAPYSLVRSQRIIPSKPRRICFQAH